MSPDTFASYLVQKDAAGKAAGAVIRQNRDALPPGDVLIRVAYSAINYKDALSASGHPGVTRKFPHVPGIDAAGTVVESSAAGFRPGDSVLVTGYDMGQNTWGGFSELLRVPADWVFALPKNLTPREAMILGTAGVTAASSIEALERNGVLPESGEIVITGASGGVGSVAVAMMTQLGYRVVAVTGKSAAADYLRALGAERTVGRDEVNDASDKPMLAPRWAGGIDTVGGRTLSTIIRTLAPHGCVAVCGLVGGTDLPLSVYPLILRAVTIAGVDSAQLPRADRERIWSKQAGPWKPRNLDAIVREEITLDALPDRLARILAGETTGRVLVRLA